MLLSAVSVLVVAQSSSEIPEELLNNPVYSNVKGMNNMLLPAKIIDILSVVWLRVMFSVCHLNCQFLLSRSLILLRQASEKPSKWGFVEQRKSVVVYQMSKTVYTKLLNKNVWQNICDTEGFIFEKQIQLHIYQRLYKLLGLLKGQVFMLLWIPVTFFLLPT